MYHIISVLGVDGDYGRIMAHLKMNLNQCFKVFFGAFLGIFLFTETAAAQSLDGITDNIIAGVSDLPGLLGAFAYLLGTVLSVWGVLKLKEHVDNASQTPLRSPVVRFLGGGALFALPSIYDAMKSLITGGDDSVAGAENVNIDGETGALGDIVLNIIGGTDGFVGLIAVAAYLGGLVLGFAAILKLKDHIENPDQTPLRESLIRFIAGGLLFGFPYLWVMASNLIHGGDPVQGGLEGVNIEGDGLSLIMNNITQDFELISQFILRHVAYLFGLTMIGLAVLKLKEHIDNPTQTPARVPVIRALVGAGFLALGTVYTAIENMVSDGNASFTQVNGGLIDGLSSVAGALGGGVDLGVVQVGTPDLNGIMANIEASLSGTEGFVIAVAYLLGAFIAFAALVKLRDHVENPDQNPLRESVVRFVVAGALFALPLVFQATSDLIAGGEDGAGVVAGVTQGVLTANLLTSPYADGNIIGSTLNTNLFGTVGAAMKGTMLKALYAPAFLHALAYIFALIIAVWGVLKIRDHVLNPTQVNIWEGVSRLVAAGAFFALPITVEAIRSSMSSDTSTVVSGLNSLTGSEYNGQTANCGGGTSIMDGVDAVFGGGNNNDDVRPGLDSMLGCMMDDILGPMHNLLSFFGYVAGTIFIMIGISRLMKSAQEGARGPGGIGTFMTFVAGGALISFNDLVKTFTFTLFGDVKTKTYAEITYNKIGLQAEELTHAHTVISAILKFMILIGLVSFVRGIFIMRGVAEGNNQSSMMAAVTHIIGGAIAINLGAFINIVQATLGISDYGITFSGGDGGFLDNIF